MPTSARRYWISAPILCMGQLFGTPLAGFKATSRATFVYVWDLLVRYLHFQVWAVDGNTILPPPEGQRPFRPVPFHGLSEAWLQLYQTRLKWGAGVYEQNVLPLLRAISTPYIREGALMGTHSWSVPPLGLLALFSAATQVSPDSARSAFSRISIFSEFSGVSPHSARSPFSCPRRHFACFLEYPPNPPALRSPIFSWSIPPLRPAVIFPVSCSIPPPRPPSVSQLPGISPHSTHRDFPSFLEYPPTSPALHVPKVFWCVPPHNSASVLHALCSTHESQFCKRSTRSGALRSHTS